MNDKTDTVTFSFGANWLNYLDTVTATELGAAGKSLVALLGVESLHGKTFLDIGCGSGLFSAAAKALGATRVISIDVDPLSVAATEQLREKSPGNSSWQILHGSILVESFAHSLPRADIVYSWGVLHHT